MSIYVNPSVQVLQIDGGQALLNPDLDNLVELNDSSSLAWAQFCEGRSREQVLDALAAEYDADPEELGQDLDELILDWLRRGLLSSTAPLLLLPYSVWPTEREEYVVYFPVTSLVLSVDRAMLETIRRLTPVGGAIPSVDRLDESHVSALHSLGLLQAPYVPDGHLSFHRDTPVRAVLLPTTSCNLNCRYCYASAPDKRAHHMSPEMARDAIDLVVANSLEVGYPSVDLSFMGGGEPTANWTTLQAAVEYARSQARELGIPSSTTLTTNGILSADQAHWVAESIDLVKVSFDGIREVQERQRPALGRSSFDVATETLRILSASGTRFIVRCTVTNESMSQLADSVQLIVEEFAPSSIIVNPVYVCGSCATSGIESIETKEFYAAYDEARDIGLERGIDVVTAYDKVTYSPGQYLPYCGFLKGNAFVTPDGYLSACSEVDTREDPRSHIFFFGRWSADSGFCVNEVKLAQIRSESQERGDSCDGCSTGSFCPGPCLVRKIDAATASRIADIRNDEEPDGVLNSRCIEILGSAVQSRESAIQCDMTQRFSRKQAILALELAGRTTGFASYELASTPEGVGCGLRVAVRIRIREGNGAVRSI